jgi:hypothetical protein
MAHHELRTLASNFVEIHICHGLHPQFSEQEVKKAHPTLHYWIFDSKDHKEEWPLCLILKYIMLAIQNKQIIVAASHTYNATHEEERELEIFNTPQDKFFGVDFRGKPRPLTRHIRLLYKLVGAKTANSVNAYTKWLKLPEVVNVILFQMQNAWITDMEKIDLVDWTPNLRDHILSEGGVRQTPTKKKKGKTKARAKENETEQIKTGATMATAGEAMAKEKETEQTTTVEMEQTTTVATAAVNETEKKRQIYS